MLRASALLLTVFTGFSGLVYEVTWQRYLATLLGSHSEATAAVLGIFLAGLSVGYSLFGRVTHWITVHSGTADRVPRLLSTYGVVEAGIGVWALAFPTVFALVQRISFAVPHGADGIGFAFDVGLCVLLIGPPTVLMGGTIPILTQALARNVEDATRFHAFVYAFNTLGAFGGALLAGFVLIPVLGLVRVLVAMSVVNLVTGGIFVVMGRRAPRVPASQTGIAPGPRVRLEGWWTYVGAALLTGFAMMVVQTVVIRMGGLSFGSSEFTFATVVSVFVLCIALGSFAVSALSRIPPWVLVVNQWSLFALLLVLYAFVDEGPYWVHVLRTFFEENDADFYPFYLSSFGALLAVIGLPVALSGATLPLLFNHMRSQVSDLGSLAGNLYSWNTVGSLAGALLGGYALFYWLDLHEIYRVGLGALALAAALVTARVTAFARASLAACAAALALLLALPNWSAEILSSQLFRVKTRQSFTGLGPRAAVVEKNRGLSFVFHRDDPVATVAVVEGNTSFGRMERALIVNGKSDGATVEDYVTMALAALLPALFAERAERSFVIGYGTGITAGELAGLSSMRSVVVAEISQGVVDAAPWFDFANQNASQNPKVEMRRSDAYRALLRSEGEFDVIASEPSNPWVMGVEMLYSREFLEAARARLSPGGVYAQWFHQYETDTKSVEFVLRTYASVFDRIAVWYSQESDLLLLGFRENVRPLDVQRLRERAERPDFAAGLARCGIRSFAALLAHEEVPMGVVHSAQFEGPVQTLVHPRLSYLAGRAFFASGEGRLPFTGFGAAARVGAENSLLRRYARSLGGLPDEDRLEQLKETCLHRRRLCVVLLADAYAHAPEVAQHAAAWLSQDRRMVGAMSSEDADELVATLVKIALQMASLMSETGGPALDDLDEAVREYERYYHHATPFEPERLREASHRCGSGDECRRAAERVRVLLEEG
ncbi:MAG: fused MFS/spermidine synthase [Myxococcales bacterium]|nr:fused MFS/spermidine synthase [Myxococcales bacterium]